jgi:hypothetical protein
MPLGASSLRGYVVGRAPQSLDFVVISRHIPQNIMGGKGSSPAIFHKILWAGKCNGVISRHIPQNIMGRRRERVDG